MNDFWRKALEANPEVMAGIERQRRELWEYCASDRVAGALCDCSTDEGDSA